MFSTKEQLIKKTGKDGIGRLNFLQQLVKEYKHTKSQDAKEQVIANLANFAYDPINYEFLWRLKVLDLFFSALESKNNNIVSYAVGGICNICLDPLHKQYILRHNGIQIISSLLTRSEESVILNSITILIYLNAPDYKDLIASAANIDRMLKFSKSTNRRIKNLADIFLQDICHIKVIKETTKDTSSNINIGASGSINTSSDINVGASCSTITSSDINLGASCSTITSSDINLGASCSTITSSDINLGASCSTNVALDTNEGASCTNTSLDITKNKDSLSSETKAAVASTST